MKSKYQGILILLIGIAVFLFLVYKFRSLFLLLLISAILSYLIHPLINGFVVKNVPVSVSIMICYVILLDLILFLVIVILPMIYRELQGIFHSIPIYYQYVLSLWDQYMANSDFAELVHAAGFDDKIWTFLSDRIDHFGEQTVNIIAMLPKAALGFLLVPVISYYFLRDKDRLVGNILMAFPPERRVMVTTLWDEIDNVLRSFILGNLLVSFFVGILTFLGLWFLDVEYAAVLGIVYGLFDIIPYFGPFLGAVPIVIFPLLQGDVNIFFVILLLFFVQQFENYFISPRILGGSVGLHPVSVIVLVLAGGFCGGVFGMILIIPAAAVVKVLLLFFYKKFVASSID